MGRYYRGDIEGKFWFAVQPSDAADRFGVTGSQPEELYYCFSKDEHLDTVKKEIDTILKELGDKYQKLETFFGSVFGYTPKQLSEYLGISEKETNLVLKQYADLVLGIKIRDQIEATGYCEFTAEL